MALSQQATPLYGKRLSGEPEALITKKIVFLLVYKIFDYFVNKFY